MSVRRRRNRGGGIPHIPPVEEEEQDIPPTCADAECQTEDSLMPKLPLLDSPRKTLGTPPRERSCSAVSSPLGGTPRQILRTRITSLVNSLSDKNLCIKDLRTELEELKDLNDFLEMDFQCREESLLAKLEDPAEERVNRLQADTRRLERDLMDAQTLLMDANKLVTQRNEEIQLLSLRLVLERQAQSVPAQCFVTEHLGASAIAIIY